MKKLIMMSLMAITILSAVACKADNDEEEKKADVELGEVTLALVAGTGTASAASIWAAITPAAALDATVKTSIGTGAATTKYSIESTRAAILAGTTIAGASDANVTVAVSVNSATAEDATVGAGVERVFTITVSPKAGYKFAAGIENTATVTITTATATTSGWLI